MPFAKSRKNKNSENTGEKQCEKKVRRHSVNRISDIDQAFDADSCAGDFSYFAAMASRELPDVSRAVLILPRPELTTAPEPKES